MTKLYRLKPLVWEEVCRDIFVARTAVAKHTVAKWRSGDRIVWNWWVNDFLQESFESLEAAQAAAEQWYRERLRPALREVEGKDA